MIVTTKSKAFLKGILIMGCFFCFGFFLGGGYSLHPHSDQQGFYQQKADVYTPFSKPLGRVKFRERNFFIYKFKRKKESMDAYKKLVENYRSV